MKQRRRVQSGTVYISVLQCQQ